MATTATLTARVISTGAESATDDLRGLERQAGRTETATENLESESRNLSRALLDQSRSSRGASLTLGGLGGSITSAVGGLSLLSGGAIGVSAALVGIITNISSLKSELILLADLSSVSVQEFQKLSTAFKTVNIDADQTSDILKDINDRVGEFILTGGGEFKDVFEKVLKPLGRTKAELSELGPGGILLAVANGFEKLGFNAKESTAILEALANDSTKLLPLLKDNGAELEKITSLIEKRGLIVNPDEVESLRKANEFLSGISSWIDNIASRGTGILARVIFGDFQESIDIVDLRIEKTQELIEKLQNQDPIFGNIFGINDNAIETAQERLRSLTAERQTLLDLERQARAEAAASLATEEIGDQRRAAEIQLEIEAEEQKRELKRETEEQKLTDQLALDAENEIRNQDRLNRELEFETEGAQRRLDLILNLNNTERQAIEKERVERLKSLQADYDKRLISEKDFQKAKMEIEKKSKVANEKLDKKTMMSKEEATKEIISKTIGLMQSGNETLFRIGQAAAVANAIVNTEEQVSIALKSAPIPFNYALAGIAAVTGGAQISAILSAQPPSARQQGGQFQSGQRLLVGEQGPELVEFGSGGRIANSNETSKMTDRSTPPAPEIIIINQTTEEIDEPDVEQDDDQRIIILIRNTVSNDFENSNSKISKSLGRSTNTSRQF